MVKITYIMHQREYTIVGITSVFQAFFQKKFIDFYGGTFADIICVIKDGIFYHFQREDDREIVSKLFLQRVNEGKIDLEKEYEQFNQNASEYEQLIATVPQDYTKELLLKFYHYYQELIRIAYASMDALDFVGVLNEDKRTEYEQWAKKVRNRAELLYKNGEMKFVPQYLEWFAHNYTKRYRAEELSYVVFTEMEEFIKSGKSLPSIQELQSRKKLFYIRQYPFDKMEYYSGEKAKKVIEEKELLEEEKEEFKDIKEFSGKTAYPGFVKGKVRLIKSRKDLDSFIKGEIIVSQMTEPDYLPIMKQAKAFITDEGGVLCHAAIVARELKKPCVIGTRIATAVLKDGDLVEVNADKGTVKKITTPK